jgi:hypothetical protein
VTASQPRTIKISRFAGEGASDIAWSQVFSASAAFCPFFSVRNFPQRQAAVHTMIDEPCADCPDTKFGLGGRGVHLVVPSLIAPVLAVALVSNRMYWRSRLLGHLGQDDIAALLALVSVPEKTLRKSLIDDIVGVSDCSMCCINSRSR